MKFKSRLNKILIIIEIVSMITLAYFIGKESGYFTCWGFVTLYTLNFYLDRREGRRFILVSLYINTLTQYLNKQAQGSLSEKDSKDINNLKPFNFN